MLGDDKYGGRGFHRGQQPSHVLIRFTDVVRFFPYVLSCTHSQMPSPVAYSVMSIVKCVYR